MARESFCPCGSSIDAEHAVRLYTVHLSLTHSPSLHTLHNSSEQHPSLRRSMSYPSSYIRAAWLHAAPMLASSRSAALMVTLTHAHRVVSSCSTVSFSPLRRSFASSPPSSSSSPSSASATSDPSQSPSYTSIHSKLTAALTPSFLHLEDTSGGCGTFYRLVIASPSFEGLSLVKQHRLVKEAIKQDIAGIHGLTIHTLTQQQLKEREAAMQQPHT